MSGEGETPGPQGNALGAVFHNGGRSVQTVRGVPAAPGVVLGGGRVLAHAGGPLGHVEVAEPDADTVGEVEQGHQQLPEAGDSVQREDGQAEVGLRRGDAVEHQHSQVPVDLEDQQERGKGGQQAPADVAQVQGKELGFVPQGLPLAHVQGLHHADAGVLIEVVEGEAVAVGGDDAGDDEQQGPEEDEEAVNNVQQDQLPHEGEPVEQGQELRPLSPADGHAVQGEARGQDGADQGDQDGDEDAEKAGVHQGGKEVQHDDQCHVQGGHGLGGNLGIPQQLRRLPFTFLAVNLFKHHDRAS